MEFIKMTPESRHGGQSRQLGNKDGIYVRGQYVGPINAETQSKANRMLGNWKGTFQPRTRQEIMQDAQRRLAEMNGKRGVR